MNDDVLQKNHAQHRTTKIEDLCEERKVSVYELVAQVEERRRKKRIEIANMLKEGPIEYCVALFIAGIEEFFREKACIDCPIDEYCACDDADMLFDVDAVMKQKLINVGEGVKMTQPIKVEKELITGDWICASLSHQGILAIYVDCNIIQFTNLNTNKQVEMRVEDWSNVGFYDSMVLLLTDGKDLREATVEEVFNDPRIGTFREIEGTGYVSPWTDVSLLHETRVLYYRYGGKLFSFNVDTKMNKRIDVGVNCLTIASLKYVYLVLQCSVERKHIINLIEWYNQGLVAVQFAVILPLCNPAHNLSEALVVGT